MEENKEDYLTVWLDLIQKESVSVPMIKRLLKVYKEF
jgi:Mn-dependent DtxR family transcriptional regulator